MNLNGCLADLVCVPCTGKVTLGNLIVGVKRGGRKAKAQKKKKKRCET